MSMEPCSRWSGQRGTYGTVCDVIEFVRDVAIGVTTTLVVAFLALFYGHPVLQLRRARNEILRELEQHRNLYMNLPATERDEPYRLDADRSLRMHSMEMATAREQVRLWRVFQAAGIIPPRRSVEDVERDLRAIDFFGPARADRQRLDEIVEENGQLRRTIRLKLGQPTPEERRLPC